MTKQSGSTEEQHAFVLQEAAITLNATKERQYHQPLGKHK
jgi:hypothetical protein